jgi:aldose 1-epimerase
MNKSTEIIRHWLKTSGGLRCEVTNFGCRIIRLFVPDRNGNFEDVVLGFDTIEEYQRPPETYFGSVVGRVANRIAHGRFELDGKAYQLALNHGEHHIHGGIEGFESKVWEVVRKSEDSIQFRYLSPSGEEGYPGNLEVWVTYSLSDEEGLSISYSAKTDEPTPINLTNHSYFNLLGAGKGQIDRHEFQIFAAKYLPNNKNQLPTGEIASVEDTVFDFRELKPIGDLLETKDEQLIIGSGFDNNYVLEGPGVRLAARVREPDSGRVMEVLTDQLGMQFFCGKAMDKPILGKEGLVYGKRAAFCLETQNFPNSINEESFPSCVLRPGEVFSSKTIYRFSVRH